MLFISQSDGLDCNLRDFDLLDEFSCNESMRWGLIQWNSFTLCCLIVNRNNLFDPYSNKWFPIRPPWEWSMPRQAKPSYLHNVCFIAPAVSPIMQWNVESSLYLAINTPTITLFIQDDWYLLISSTAVHSLTKEWKEYKELTSILDQNVKVYLINLFWPLNVSFHNHSHIYAIILINNLCKIIIFQDHISRHFPRSVNYILYVIVFYFISPPML